MKQAFYLFIFFLITSCRTVPITGIGVGFYNVENLFDTTDDPKIDDDYYLPNSRIKWDETKYQKKLEDLAFVIAQMVDNQPPQFLGLCEVENKKVVQDLANQPKLSAANYGVVHYDSRDERGIDVAFLYNTSVFSVKTSKTYSVNLPDNDRTRDILYVKGKLANGEILHFLINHWPSRSEGRTESESKRIEAAKTLQNIKNEILAKDS
ncbi:MAG: hypothetical protein RLZZ337_1879, partial [Bacteroidota bacterium]